MRHRRSAEEVAALVDQFKKSDKTRLEFCREAGIGKSTLDRWIQQSKAQPRRFVRVKVAAGLGSVGGFVLVLANGRRIESGWKFDSEDLGRLIRTAETV
jgi:hypothetical protein